MRHLLYMFLTLLPVGVWAQNISVVSPVRMLALGDSYTIGHSVDATERFPVQLIDSLRAKGVACQDPDIIATSGWTTYDLQSALSTSQLSYNYTLVSLLIGVNDYYQGMDAAGYTTRFTALLNTAIAHAKGDVSHVFVVSIPDYGFTPFGHSMQTTITAGIDNFNAINQSITSNMHVPYIFITDISRGGLSEPDLVATDGLHPSGKQYAQWVHRILVSATLAGSDTTSVTTGVHEQTPNAFAYPNPFDKYLIIENDTSHYIELINQLGQVVFSSPMDATGKTTTLDVSMLPPGFYVYKTRTASGHTSIRKVLKY